jgi:hypothetical protein
MRKIPDLSLRKETDRALRNRRLGRALRENLRRRKLQTRARDERGAGSAGPGLSDAPVSGKSDRHGGTTAD